MLSSKLCYYIALTHTVTQYPNFQKLASQQKREKGGKEWVWSLISSFRCTNEKRMGFVKRTSSTRHETITCSWHVIKAPPEKANTYTSIPKKQCKMNDWTILLYKNLTQRSVIYSLKPCHVSVLLYSNRLCDTKMFGCAYRFWLTFKYLEKIASLNLKIWSNLTYLILLERAKYLQLQMLGVHPQNTVWVPVDLIRHPFGAYSLEAAIM